MLRLVLCLLLSAFSFTHVFGAAIDECSLYKKSELNKKNSCYREKAEAGNSFAQNYLGTIYLQGEGVKQSFSESMKWFMKSARQGDSLAQLNIGVIYAAGYGVKINDRLAYKWFLKSAANGNKTARKYIVKLLFYNKSDPLSITGNNDSSLRVALYEGDKKLVKLLLNKGVILDESDEDLHVGYIKLMGPLSSSFIIKDFLPAHSGPGGRFTIDNTNALSDSPWLNISMEKKGDYILTKNGVSIIDAENTVMRFKGEVKYKGYLFNGSVKSPITFFLTKAHGLIFLTGQGNVLLKTGEKITFKNGVVLRENKANSFSKQKENKKVKNVSLLPDNGYVFFKGSGKLIAPLEILTKNQNYHYYVKISDRSNNKVVKTLFLRSGGVVKTKLPLGSYNV